MRMIKVEVFKFEELSEDVRKKLIEKEREFIHFDFDWLLKLQIERLEEQGFIDADIQYSGFWSQGDGASFTAKIDNKKLGIDSEAEFVVVRGRWNYCHELTCHVECKDHYDKETLLQIEEDRLEACKTIYKELGLEFEYQTSDETLSESLQDCEYTVDGSKLVG